MLYGSARHFFKLKQFFCRSSGQRSIEFREVVKNILESNIKPGLVICQACSGQIVRGCRKVTYNKLCFPDLQPMSNTMQQTLRVEYRAL